MHGPSGKLLATFHFEVQARFSSVPSFSFRECFLVSQLFGHLIPNGTPKPPPNLTFLDLSHKGEELMLFQLTLPCNRRHRRHFGMLHNNMVKSGINHGYTKLPNVQVPRMLLHHTVVLKNESTLVHSTSNKPFN